MWITFFGKGVRTPLILQRQIDKRHGVPRETQTQFFMKSSPVVPTQSLIISTSMLVNGKPLSFQGFKTLIANQKSADSRAFESSLMLAAAVHTGRTYYEEHKGTELLKAQKVATLNDFWQKCGFNKAQIESKWVAQLVRAGSATPEQVVTYKETAKKEGAQCSVKGLNKWLSQVAKAVEDGATQAEAEAQAEVGVAKTEATKAKSPFVMNVDLSFFGVGEGHAKVHVHPDGLTDTNMSPEAFLQLAHTIAAGMRAAQQKAA